MTRFATDARTSTEFERILGDAPPQARQLIDEVPHEEQFPILAGCMRGRQGSSPAESDNNSTAVARRAPCLITKMRALAQNMQSKIMKNAQTALDSPLNRSNNLTPHVLDNILTSEKFVDENIDSSKVTTFANDPTIAQVKARTQNTA